MTEEGLLSLQWAGDLSSALEHSLRSLRTPGPRLGILFSAGVDSALLAWELRHRPGVVLSTLGREGSSDLLAAREGARRVGLPWEELRFDAEDVARAEETFAGELEGTAPVQRSVLVALALAIDRASPGLLVCGQGVDELFLGYAHYRGLDDRSAEERSRTDFERLLSSDWPRTQRIARLAGKEVVAPYLDPAFEEAARRIPISLRRPEGSPKRFFREWALARGLPPELASRPKKALQYGSGVDSILRKRRRGPRR